MESSLQHQAILNLIDMCDDDAPAIFKNMQYDPEYNILAEHPHYFKSNTVTINQKLNYTTKVKTQAQPSLQRYADSTQNKQNLKKILQKLKDSPSPKKKRKIINKKQKQCQPLHIKTLNSQVQSRSKQFHKTPQIQHKSGHKLIQRQKQKDLIKSLVKAKIIQKLKMMQQKKTFREFRQTSFRISTVRQIQGIKRGQIALKGQKRQGSSYHNLLKEERSIKNIGSLLNGRGSRIDLKHLLF